MKLAHSRCLKITKKVSINIASEASYVYLLNGQKFIKNAQNGHFGDFLKLEACCQTVLPDRSMFKGQNLAENPTLWVIFKHCDSMNLVFIFKY